MSTPALSPQAVAVLGISQEIRRSLNDLAMLTPTEANPAEELLRNLQEAVRLANRITPLPNLLDQYNTGANAALVLPGIRKELRDLREAHQGCDQRITNQAAQMEGLREELEGARAVASTQNMDLQVLRRSLIDLQATTAPTEGGAPAGGGERYAKIPDPPEFSAGREEYRDFKNKLEEKFRGDARKFRDEDHKLSYAMGFLKGETYRMVQPLRRSGAITTIEQLIGFLDSAHEDPDRKGTAKRELRELRQGKQEFASHFARFAALAAETDWNDEAKRSTLYQSLSDGLKDHLTTQLRLPRDLMGFVEIFQAADQILRA